MQVLSRDSVTVSVDAVVYYRVSNPTMATNNIEDYRYILTVFFRKVFENFIFIHMSSYTHSSR